MIAKLFAALAIGMVLPAHATYDPAIRNDYPRYTATDMVERYKHDPSFYDQLANGGSPDVGGYFMGLTGVFMVFICGCCLCCGLCCWNCGTMQKMDGTSGACTPPVACASMPAKMTQLGLAAFLMLLIFIFAGLGFDATAKDDAAIRALPNVLGSVADRMDYLGSEINQIEVLYNYTSANQSAIVNALETVSNSDAIALANKTAEVNSLTTEMRTAINEVDEAILSGSGSIKSDLSSGANDVRSAKSDADEQIEQMQDARNDLNIAVLVFTLLVAGCAVAAIVFPALKDSAREHSGRYCGLSGCVICFMFIIFFFAGFYLLLTTLLADACFDPSGWVVLAMKVPSVMAERSQSQNASVYYIECGGYARNQLQEAWPMTGTLVDMGRQCESLSSASNALTNTLNGTGVDVTAEITAYNAANEALCIGLLGETGLVGYNGTLRCAVINSLWEEMLIDLCDDVHTPMALMFEFFIVIAVILCISEFLQKGARRMADADPEAASAPPTNSPPAYENPAYVDKEVGAYPAQQAPAQQATGTAPW